MSESEAAEAIDLAWGIIANASGGNWEKETPEWQEAAARWRDKYVHKQSEPPKP